MLIHINFLTGIAVNLFCCEKVLTDMNIWMIGKISVKHHRQRKKIFRVTQTMKVIADADYGKKSLQRFLSKRFRWISWFICLKQYIHVLWTWPCSFIYCTKISMASSPKKINVKWGFSTDTNMLLMIEKCITAGICQTIY